VKAYHVFIISKVEKGIRKYVYKKTNHANCFDHVYNNFRIHNSDKDYKHDEVGIKRNKSEYTVNVCKEESNSAIIQHIANKNKDDLIVGEEEIHHDEFFKC